MGFLEVLNRIDGHAQARHAGRMTHGDAAAVEVVRVPGNAELALHVQVHHRERLVHLEIVNLGNAQARSLEQLLNSGHRPVAHDSRGHAHHGPVDDPSLRGHRLRLESLPAAYQHGRSAVRDSGRVTRRDLPALPERGLQTRKALHVDALTGGFVHLEGARAAPVGNVHGHDLPGQKARVDGGEGSRLAGHRVLVHGFPVVLKFFREVLGRFPHVLQAERAPVAPFQDVFELLVAPDDAPAGGGHRVRRAAEHLRARGKR